MDEGAAQAWFIAGTLPFLIGGGVHLLAILLDTVRPTFFIPTESSVRPAVEGSGVRFWRLVGAKGERPSMWRMWMGMHFSHALGTFTFALLCLLIASYDFDLVERIDAIRPLTIAYSAAYLAVSLRYWLYLTTIITATSTACFTVAAVLST